MWSNIINTVYLWTRTRRPVVVNFAIRSRSTSSGAARGSAFVLLTHLSRATIIIGFALVTASGERRTIVTRQAAAHRHVVDHLALGVLATRTRITLFLYKTDGFHYNNSIKIIQIASFFSL